MSKPLKLRKDQQLRPLGGHHFIEGRLRIEGETLDEVIRKLTDYRVNNSVPVGNPEQEILVYYLGKYPYMVDIDYEAVDSFTQGYYEQKWLEWIRRHWKRPASKQITPKEAESRWNVCLNCPHNIKLSVSTQEDKESERKSFLLRRGQTTPEKLGFCSLHLWDTRASVFLEAPAEVSGKLKDAANYPGCWCA